MLMVVAAVGLPLVWHNQFEGLWIMMPIGWFALGVWETWRGVCDLHRMRQP